VALPLENGLLGCRGLFELGLISLYGRKRKEAAATPRSIAYRDVTASQLQAVADKAQEHCGSLGRDAEIVPDALVNRATFRCVDR